MVMLMVKESPWEARNLPSEMLLQWDVIKALWILHFEQLSKPTDFEHSEVMIPDFIFIPQKMTNGVY